MENSNGAQSMRLLLAGSHGALAAVAAGLLDPRRFRIERMITGEETLRRIDREPFDMVAFDVALPDMPGLAFLRRLRIAHQPIPVMALVRSGAEWHDPVPLLDAGADDVVTLPCNHEEFAARVAAVARRSRRVPPASLRCGDIELYVASRHVLVNGRDLRLSPAEFWVLHQLLVSASAPPPTLPVPRAALMEALYDDPDAAKAKAFAVMLHRLRRRLAAAGANVRINTVWGLGYTIAETPRPLALTGWPGQPMGVAARPR